MTSLHALAARIVDVAQTSLPGEVVHETRRCAMNVIGTSLGASRTREIDALIATSQQLGGAEVAVLGRPESIDRYAAASVVGFAAHFDDFDDTHLETVIHPGAATLGALMSLNLMQDLPGEAVLAAMALGVEVQLRIGLAMSPSHYDLGWHITGTCGVMGAAVAAGIALELDADALANAMGLAATMIVGHREAFGTPIKPYHAGKAASNGLLAAMMARAGATVDTDVFTDEHGYFALLSDECSMNWIRPSELGQNWTICDNTYKPFPCGIVAHPAIEAAIEVHRAVGQLRGNDVTRVRVACNPLVVELMGRKAATTGLEARFCAVHGVTVGLLTGRGGLAEFSDEMANDAEVVSLRSRTTLDADQAHSRDAATVTVEFVDGSSRSASVIHASGSKDRPLTDEQLRAKFLALTEPIVGRLSAALSDAAMQLGDSVTFADIDAMVRNR